MQTSTAENDDKIAVANDQNQNRRKKVRFAFKRKKWIHDNVVTTFYRQGSKSISKIFPDNLSPEKINMTFEWHIKTNKQKSSNKSPSIVPDSTVRETPRKELIRSISLLSSDEIMSDISIMSSYPIMKHIETYIENSSRGTTAEYTVNISTQGISKFVATCQRQIEEVIQSTNNYLSQYVDLNSAVLITGQQTFIKVHTIRRWTHIRILEDTSNQRYIAMKNSRSQYWFVLSQSCPLSNQRWVCYPLHSMNTLDNELNIIDGTNIIRKQILQMIMLKCFHKTYNDCSSSITFDADNILLVATNCGFIVVFKEGNREFDMASCDILQTESFEDIPVNCCRAKRRIKDAISEFFHDPHILPILISSLWPIDYLAFIFAKLVTKSES